MLTQSLTGKFATLTASLVLSCAIVTSASAGERQDGAGDRRDRRGETAAQAVFHHVSP